MPAKAKAAPAPRPADPVYDLDYKAPAPAPAVEERWTEIVDVRKERYEKSKLKKAAEAKEKLLSSTDLTSDDAVAKALTGVDPIAEKLHGIKANAKGPNKTAKKKAKATAPKYAVITSEKQLVEAVISLLQNVPNNQHIQCSAVGDRLQTLTGKAWKKQFAPTYGSLPEFFKKRPAYFHVDSNQKVYIRSDWDAIRTASDPLGAPAKSAKQKKAAANAAAGIVAGANGNAGAKKGGDSAAAEVAEDSSALALRMVFVLILVMAVATGVFMGVEGITFSQLLDRLRNQF